MQINYIVYSISYSNYLGHTFFSFIYFKWLFLFLYILLSFHSLYMMLKPVLTV